MTDQRDYQNEESPVVSGPAPDLEPEYPLVPVSLVTQLTRAEIDQQISTAHAYPRSPARARDRMISLATMDEKMSEECIYSVPRGGKQIRGPSIRLAEIVAGCWGNIRVAARVTHEDRIERYVEAEAIVHDLENNMGWIARARRRIELKKGRKTVDLDMIQLAGGAAMAVARRNAIFAAVPKPVWARAQEAVEAVIKGDQKTLVERRDAAISYFNKAGVPIERILKALEVSHLDDITLDHLVDLSGMRSALKSGENTLDQLFPEERAPAPKPETLDDKLKALSRVDPQTGEIIEESDGAGAAEATSEAVPATAQTPVEHARAARARGPRKPSIQERLQAEGAAAAAKGTRALDEWYDSLTSDDLASIPLAIDRVWHEIARKADA